MTPMNIISEIAQPISMAFRHFGNVAGGGVITTILYSALSLVSAIVLNLIASSGAAVSIVLLVLALGLILWGRKNGKKAPLIFGIITNLVVNGGKMGTGEEETPDALSGAAENMGNVEFEDTNKKK